MSKAFCSSFNVFFFVFVGKLSRTKTLNTVLKSAEGMPYGATDSLSTLLRSVGDDL